MKCQECGINTATTHVKTMVNGTYSEYMLCPECAGKMGYGNMFNDFSSEFGNLLGSFFGHALPERTQATRCSTCGSSYSDIAKSGLVGCSKCYEVFRKELMPSIRNMHGNTSHCGKKAVNILYTGGNESKPETIKELKAKMEQAIQTQDFETAAKLRDKIKEMEGMQHD